MGLLICRVDRRTLIVKEQRVVLTKGWWTDGGYQKIRNRVQKCPATVSFVAQQKPEVKIQLKDVLYLNKANSRVQRTGTDCRNNIVICHKSTIYKKHFLNM